jgi:hypothetical protein
MTIKDGFKFGVGLILAQLLLAILTLALALPTLYLIGSTVKQKVVESLLNTATESETSK